MTKFSERISRFNVISGLDSGRFNQIKQMLKQRSIGGKTEYGANEFNFALSQGINRETLHMIRKAKNYREYLQNRNKKFGSPKKIDK